MVCSGRLEVLDMSVTTGVLRAVRFGLKYAVHSLSGARQPLRLLWGHRELLRLLAKRDIAVRTSGTALGGIWMILQPGLQVLAFWFLLDFVLRVRFPGKVSFLDYFLIGMVPWLMVSEVMNRSLAILTEFGALYRRSAFPLPILPLLPLLVSGSIYGVVYVGTVLLLQGPVVALRAPAIMLGLMLWLVPICYMLAVVGVFLREVGQVFPFLVTMLMYLTPILYMPQMLPEPVRAWWALNPFADLMAVIHGLLQGLPYTAGNLLRPVLVWALLLGPAWVMFRRSEPHVREAL